MTAGGAHKEPEILNLVKVVDFMVEPRNGATIVLQDQNTKQELTLGYVPRRLYGYPIYMSVPSKLTLRWDARVLPDGRVWRSLAFAVLIKTKNKSDFYSKGNTYVETPNRFRQLYAGLRIPIEF